MSVPSRDLGRVLVTGASGFLGKALVRRLKGEAVDVVATDASAAVGGIDAVLDVTEFDAVETVTRESRCRTILHCGAVSGPMVLADRPLDIWRINALGSANVLEAARRAGVERVVLCSTIDVYGTGTQEIMREDRSPDPVTVYGASKAAAEQTLIGYRRQHGLDAVALRLSWIYGPGRRTPTTLERVLRAGLAGEAVTVGGSATDMTHYIHLDDAVAGLLAAARVEVSFHPVFNITAGRGVIMDAVASAIRETLPDLALRFDGSAADAFGPAGFDQERAASDLGFLPKIAFAEGVSRYVRALT